VVLGAPTDTLHSRVGWLLTNANGVIYRASIDPADLSPSSGGRFEFTDPGARVGQGGHDGLYKIKLLIKNGGGTFYKVKWYGDMSAATLPEMALQFYVEDQVFLWEASWTQTGGGWVGVPGRP